jgi:APA family basic amino acid/polyamine antiporter
MIVMGGIIGSGIFMNPYVVARAVHSPLLILAAWGTGGLIAIVGAFIYAELAERRPQVGGQYAYIREAFHPAVAFVYGWGLLLVTQTGGMAAVAVTFARYFVQLSHFRINDAVVASLALAVLTVINCLGVKAGSSVQSVLMIMKIVAILLLVVCGFAFTRATDIGYSQSVSFPAPSLGLITSFGTALIPVLFAYGGWQTACFIAGEVDEPKRNLPRALLLGVGGVVVLYLAVNAVCLRVLGVEQVAATTTPATDVMRKALGEMGSALIAAGISISTLGFLSQGILTAPRVYYAMAKDGLFFKSVGALDQKSKVPVAAIVLQGIFAIIITISGRYEQILNYVVSVDFIFFALAAACLFQLRRNDAIHKVQTSYNVPGHPWTTVSFIVACAVVALNTVYRYPENTIIGYAILAAGIPVYFGWRLRSAA